MKYYSGFPSRISLLRLLATVPLSNLVLPSMAAGLSLLAGFTFTTSAQVVETNIVTVNYNVLTREKETSHTIERRAFDLVNNERINSGRRPLLWTDLAAATARAHSADMAMFNYFDHRDLNGRLIGYRADQSGLSDWRQIGENIAWLSGAADPATRVVGNWMNSTSHRENILSSEYRESGIGLSIAGDGKYYFTQVFVLRK